LTYNIRERIRRRELAAARPFDADEIGIAKTADGSRPIFLDRSRDCTPRSARTPPPGQSGLLRLEA